MYTYIFSRVNAPGWAAVGNSDIFYLHSLIRFVWFGLKFCILIFFQYFFFFLGGGGGRGGGEVQKN